MSGIILPPFIGAPEEAPASSSGLLVYDEIWVREPRLMVPGQKPTGNVVVNRAHWVNTKVPVVLALFRSPDQFNGPNADDSDFFIHNIADSGVKINQAGYPTYFERSVFNDGEYFHNGASFGGFPIDVRATSNAWGPLVSSQEFTVIASGRWHLNDAQLEVITGADGVMQLTTIGTYAGGLYIRPICSAYWSASYDLTVPITRVANEPFSIGFSWSKSSGVRCLAMHNGFSAETSGLTGTFTAGTSKLKFAGAYVGSHIKYKHFYLFAKKMSINEMRDIFLDPYQFLIPA